MGDVQVVDRGQREIVVFLSGDVDEAMAPALAAAVEEVDGLEHINLLNRAVVDLHGVTALGPEGVRFLRALDERGRRHGFDVSLAALSGPAHRTLESAGWRFAEHSPGPD